MSELTNGMRMRCEACGSEAIVLTAAAAEPSCCGMPMKLKDHPTAKEH